MKKYLGLMKSILMVMMIVGFDGPADAQTIYPVSVRIAVIPPVSPYFDRMLQGVGGMHLMVSLYGAPSATGGQGQYQVKLAGTLERLSPSPFTLTLNTNFESQQPVFVPYGATMMLTNSQLEQSFGNLIENNLTIEDIAFGAITDGINYKLPEGIYRLCITAYPYGVNGYARPLSDPNAGCVTFTVCYMASAPQFVQPVNAINLESNTPTVNPSYPLIFSWTAPNTTCGSAIPPVTYDLEIHQIFNGQTPTDAINNAPVFMKQGLPTAIFPFDTMLYKNVLQQGVQYAIRVHANTGVVGAVGNATTFDNDGYSRVQAFQYGNTAVVRNPIDTTKSETVMSDTTKNVIPNIETQKTDTTNTDTTKNANANQTVNKPQTQQIPASIADSTADCGIALPSDSTSVNLNTDLKGKTLTIGGFTLTPTTITQNNTDSTYSGSGTIDWKPFLHTVKLAVVFKNIKVNKSNVIFKGLLTSSNDSKISLSKVFSSFGDFASQSATQLDQLSGSVESFLKQYPGTQLLTQIATSSPVSFPIGIDNQKLGSTPTTVAIMSMAFSPKGATMAVMVDVNVPEANGWLSLAGTNFCLQPTGAKFTQGTLFLPVDHHFNFGSANDSIDFAFKGCPSADSTKGTYVSWAGDSLSAIVAHATVTFSKNTIVRQDSTGKAMDSAVVATVGFNFHNWDDWIASITFQNFQLPGVKGLGFSPDTIYYDHSSKRNPTGFNFPKSYTGYTGVDFEGLYIKDMSVQLPTDFKTFNQGKQRTSFHTKDFVIDTKGVSVTVLGENIINLTTGNLGGWAFSLDTVKVVITQNTFTEGAFNGKIELPVSKDSLVYCGDLHTGGDSLQYQFVIQPPDSLEFDIWLAKVELNKNSAFMVKHDSTGTQVSCVLSGTLGINLGGNGTTPVNLPGLSFDSLGIANYDFSAKKYKLWISKGNWSFGSGSGNKSQSTYHFNVPLSEEGFLASGPNYSAQDMAASFADSPTGGEDDSQASTGGFPVSINNIEPYTDFSDMSNLKLGLQFDLNINVGFGDQSVISATTNLMVYGTIDASVQNMAPHITGGVGIDIDSIKIKGDVGPISVDGMLVFYKHDNTYGDGVKGHVVATFPMVQIEATAQFGNVNNYNYWYIDACANFANPIPVVGLFGISGFGGGAYYNMAMTTSLPGDPANLQAVSKADNATPGQTMSGVTFVPQANSAGIRATVCIATTSGGDAMNAKVTLTAQITNGALSLLDLNGNVYVLTNSYTNDQATIKGAVDIQYDFTQKKFSLNADIQGQFAMIQADIPIGMYGGPDGWYFKVGDAFGKRVSFTLVSDTTDVFLIHVGATAYFEMGSLINPALPPLPDALIAFGVQRSPDVDNLVNSMNKADGNGFMFGAEVDGHLKFSVAFLYADIQAVLGFDLALKHFEQSFQCGGSSAGWQNWYALGQLYFYFDLDVGVHVDCWFAQGDFDLVKFQAGAVLSAGLPNPTWLDGSVHVTGSILGGLVSLDEDMHFTVGDKCYPAPAPLSDINIISDYGPQSKGGVFDYPYVASNVGLGVNYDIQVPPTSQNPNGETRTYRFDILSYQLTENGVNEPGIHIQYQNDNTTGIIVHDNMLKPNTNYTVNVVCNAMQFYPDENRWDNPFNDKDNAREPEQQTTTWNFTTGDAPVYIPDNMVHFSYPVNNERHVLKQELSGSGVLQMNEWMNNILSNSPADQNQYSNLGGGGFNYKLYFISVPGGDTVKTNFTANQSTRTLNYTLPSGLQNNTVYKVEFWSVPAASSNFMLKAVSKVSSSTRTMTSAMVGSKQAGSSVTANIKKTTIAGPVSAATGSVPIYVLYFKTSQYNTFSDKINAMGNWNASRSGKTVLIQNQNLPPELFDQYEIQGFKSPDGTSYPPLFNARIEWDHWQTNDKFADDNLYGNALTLAFKQVQSNFAVPELREQIYKPVLTLDWSDFATEPPLGLSETMTPAQYKMATASNTVTHLTMGASNNSSSNSIGVLSSAGYSFILPASSRAKTSKGQTVMNVKMPQPYQFKWTRDYYIQEDFNLMSALGLVAQTQASIIEHQLDPSQAEDILSHMSGNINFVGNDIGGSVTMPWNKFYYLYTDPNSMNILNQLRYLKFEPFPAGTRNINFRYQAGTLQGGIITKPFTLK